MSEFNKEEFETRSVPFSEAKEWVRYKHYAHRIPTICYAFGLYWHGVLQGVCTFGIPPAKDLATGAMGPGYKDMFLELNRLVVNDGLPRNALSFFVASCLRMLPRPMVVVSYADSGVGHHGYIYQATNWLYTGLTDRHVIWEVKGLERMHQRHITDGSAKVGHGKSKREALIELYGDRVVESERSRKHRYFQFLGDKRQVRKMRRDLKYPVIPDYPKGDNARYDASYETHPNGILF